MTITFSTISMDPPGWRVREGVRCGSFVRSPLARWLDVSTLRRALQKILQGPHFPVSSTAPAPARESLLPRVASGDAGAMKGCIGEFGGLVWTIVRRQVRELADAEDLVQEIFTEVWKKAGSYRADVASEATFVGVIARRRTIDYLRRSGRRPGFEPLDAADGIPAGGDEAMNFSCDPEAVRESLTILNDETRELFRLCFDEGLSHQEMVVRTGLPLGTVKTRLRRGLILLRDHLRRGQPVETP